MQDWSTIDLLTAVVGQAWKDDLLTHRKAEGELADPTRTQALVDIVVDTAMDRLLRIKAARVLTRARLTTSEWGQIRNLLIRQAMHVDADLIRILVPLIPPNVGRAFKQSEAIQILFLLLNCPEVESLARSIVLRTLGPMLEVGDVELLFMRVFRSPEERREFTNIMMDLLTRPIHVGRISSAGFEHLGCRVLEARARALGQPDRFVVVGGPHDGGVDGVGGKLHEMGADDPGTRSVVVQCRRTRRFSMDDVVCFERQVAERYEKQMSMPIRGEGPPLKKIFVTIANPKNKSELVVDADLRGVELIFGPEFCELMETYTGRQAYLS